MNISPKDVRHVAGLARLQFSDNEIDTYTDQLNSILTYFEKLQSVDTADVPPSTHAVRVSNVFRDDIIEESLSSDAALRNAPDREESCFKVPKIIGG
ncbi:MAG: Asp-tRNA(Asn)/Glu-tRNA(Gln) amidotransferase subunit GatC [Deltaproteobacteria bacterium]|nr:Asp-tRNA(Asn)/Glu-tRNA(Gln) amidotransferase subunit GatC [Deltaproteobacteria bacterium]